MEKADKKSILIVDDEIANIISLTDILEPEFDVRAVRDSLETVEIAEVDKPAVILLDIIMPVMSGYDVISALKSSEKTRDIPVIFITGLDDITVEAKVLALGAADYIAKPFHAPIVTMRIQNQIDNMERHRQLAEHLEAKESAEQSSRAKSEILSRLNKEMRPPIYTILDAAQNSSKVEASLSCIETNARLLLQLLDDAAGQAL